MMNTRLSALFLSLLMLLSLVGCGGKEESETPPPAEDPVIEDSVEQEESEIQYDPEGRPIMEALYIDNVIRTQIDDGKISYYIPAGSWVKGTDSNGETVVLFRDTAQKAQQVSAQAKLVGFYGSELDESFMDEIVDSLDNDLSLTVTTSEMRSFQNAPIYYSEMSVEFTDEVLDRLVESGIWTEEKIEENGGREAYKKIPKTNTIMIYAVIDGYMVTYGGSYYDDAQKKIVLNAINVMLQTTEVL